mmetsp:Transcript_109315/g.315955  ORF Transcript_109315/g.315955 Transcript_109315/m.315955 type:complete len:92 (+) Transcript_109315:59-334(+)|eukprot:CAMPEP_0176091170 /NCGR_PEP_ID=MMETSP0120_2-20121206/45664_1 /TAXON_ID=160619 /ORGANISM="Kryptoperidinium foliaceum, Strain CCMP 1326" /LENGTH=91 /DNA_ID=CAMNT_0017425061 /DNA_START=38 /DNA_END=313 /DNA_ORIENTATION=+
MSETSYTWVPYTPATSLVRAKEVEAVDRRDADGAATSGPAIEDTRPAPVLKVGSLTKPGIRGLVPLSYKGARRGTEAADRTAAIQDAAEGE